MQHFFRFFSFSLLLILFNSNLVAQIVTIPNVYFKNKLIALGVDTNGDNNIQVSEALSVTSLDVSNTSNIGSMVGIEAFTNLDTLRCGGNSFSTLNISTLVNLRYLDCHFSNIYSLNVNGCVSLNYLDCHNASSFHIDSLDVSSSVNLTYLDCHGPAMSNNILVYLNISGCTNLQYLDCSHQQLSNGLDLSNRLGLTYLNCCLNSISSINLSNCPSLSYVDCHANILDSLDLSNRPNLSYLNCRSNYNYLTYLNISGCTSLIHIECQHNALTSLDVSNFTNLETLLCDYNNISLFNISNCFNLVKLDCEYNAIPSLNLANFTNLDSVNCYSNQITNLDVSNCSNLTYLYCENNPFVSINALNCSNLVSLILTSTNSLTSLQLGNCYSLIELICDAQLLTVLHLSTCTNLQTIYCHNNSIDTLDIFNGPNLINLHCNNNHLKSLNVSNCVNLVGFSFAGNPLVGLDISNCTSLTSFDYNLNNANHDLQYLNADNCTSLTSLTCNNLQLSTLNIGNCTNLQTLNCQHNALTSLEVSTCPNLDHIYASWNNIYTFDASNCSHLQYLNIESNDLHRLSVKNGTHEGVQIYNSTLLYVCGDANDIAYLKQHAAPIPQNVIVTSFCSYGLGGEYNTITGNAFYDSDANGCTSQDIAYPYFALKTKKGLDSAISYTNTAGLYHIYTDSGNYSLEPIFQNPNYFTSNPSTTNINFSTLNTTQTQDFCITANATFPDVEITCINISGQPRPGFDTQYKLHIANKGTNTASGNIVFDFMGNKMTLISTSLPPSQQTSNQLTWAYSNLLPFETRTIDIKMNILPPPTNAIGDSLGITTHISLINDADASNNLFKLNEIVVGAYDPNDKTCLEGEIISPTQIGNYLHYIIRFQNTGTFYAENVVVVDTLDATKFDLSSIQILDSSHPTHIDLINNTLQFYFEGIMLPDSFSNEPASHGYVFFKIKTKNTLATNTTVQNTAEIYFDFNPPVITNTATSTFTNTVGITPSVSRNNLQFYPNPAHTTLTIQVAKTSSVSLFNAIGEIIKEEPVQTKSIWDISSLPSGIYMIKADSNTKGQIFIKE